VRSLRLESGGWCWVLVSARSPRYAGPFDVTPEVTARDSVPLCAGWPLVEVFSWSDGSSEFSATSRFPAECCRADVACWMVKPISTIVAMFLSDSCCNNSINCQWNHKFSQCSCWTSLLFKFHFVNSDNSSIFQEHKPRWPRNQAAVHVKNCGCSNQSQKDTSKQH